MEVSDILYPVGCFHHFAIAVCEMRAIPLHDIDAAANRLFQSTRQSAKTSKNTLLQSALWHIRTDFPRKIGVSLPYGNVIAIFVHQKLHVIRSGTKPTWGIAARFTRQSKRPTGRHYYEELKMFKLFKAILVCGSLAFCSAGHAAAEHGSREEAIALVQKAIASIKANGREKTIAEINNVQGTKFRDRDLYITVNDMNAKNLAHGSNPRMQGKDLIDLKDADGKAFMRERLELVKAKGKGWQDYKFVNPVSKQVEDKSMYFEKFEDLIVNCGVYK